MVSGGFGKQRAGEIKYIVKVRRNSLLVSPAALIRYLIGHRLASAHESSEVCLPSSAIRKTGEVAGNRATFGEIYLRGRSGARRKASNRTPGDPACKTVGSAVYILK